MRFDAKDPGSGYADYWIGRQRPRECGRVLVRDPIQQKPAPAATHTSHQLEALSGLHARTLRHWFRQKVLPKPLGRGRAARYDPHRQKPLPKPRARPSAPPTPTTNADPRPTRAHHKRPQARGPGRAGGA